MTLDLASLEMSVATLRASVAKVDDSEFMSGLDEVARSTLQSGATHHFEVAYERCWKFMKRWLELNVSPTIADGVPRRELFRIAAEHLLIDDVDRWMRHHDASIVASYAHDLAVADTAVRAAGEFAPDALRLLGALTDRND